MQLQLILISTFVALAASEAPKFNPRYHFQRVEEAPYPPAGYRPAGQEFRLPARQQSPPSLYGPPQEYGPPENGVPVTTEGMENDATTTEVPTTTVFTPAARSELKNLKQRKPEKVQEERQVLDQGVYYIYHPSGFLQRVAYETRNDVMNMGYTAQLTYRDVEPIREPIYTYDPQTLIFQQIKL